MVQNMGFLLGFKASYICTLLPRHCKEGQVQIPGNIMYNVWNSRFFMSYKYTVIIMNHKCEILSLCLV